MTGTIDHGFAVGSSSTGQTIPRGDSGHQGHFGETFIRALAAAANLDALRADRDRVGVDWTLRFPGPSGRRGFPLIAAQVKSWPDPRGNALDWRYPLAVQTYN